MLSAELERFAMTGCRREEGEMVLKLNFLGDSVGGETSRSLADWLLPRRARFTTQRAVVPRPCSVMVVNS